MSRLHKDVPVVTKITEGKRVVAFVNWSLPKSDGSFIKASKGFLIFQNPRYPNKHEDLLVELAQEHGGCVEVTLRCSVVINKTQETGKVNKHD
jgi:hypothetical protein